MLVREKMISPGRRISATLPLSFVVETFENAGVLWLPVIDMEGRLLGLITAAEIRKARQLLEKTDLRKEKEPTAKDCMTTKYLYVTENTPIEEAVRMMVDYDMAELPVVKDGFFTGIVTEKNMLRFLMEITGARRQGVRLMVELESRTGELLDLMNIISDQKGTIQGLCTYCAQESEYMIATLRVEGVDKYSLKQAIKNSGRKVVDIR